MKAAKHRDQKRFLVHYIPEMELIPMPPPDFFENVYTPSEIEDNNMLSKASTIQVPKDLE